MTCNTMIKMRFGCIACLLLNQDNVLKQENCTLNRYLIQLKQKTGNVHRRGSNIYQVSLRFSAINVTGNTRRPTRTLSFKALMKICWMNRKTLKNGSLIGIKVLY